ncbi:MAG: class IV adenylate cyclase [Thermoplasmata archaeon]
MFEIEIKSRIDDPDQMEYKIKKIGAKFEMEIIQEDIYFKHPCKDFKITDEALRLRKMNNEFFLTYKGPKVDKETKTREEIELKTDEKILDLLKNLGFSIAGVVRKIRKNYRINDMVISIDNVEKLGYFVEIETFGDLESGKEKILKMASDLGLNRLERRSYFELMVGEKDGQD